MTSGKTAPSAVPLSEMLKLVMHWTEALHGRGTLDEALEDLACALRVEAAKLVRLRFESGVVSEIAVCDRAAEVRPALRLERFAVEEMLGERARSARPSSLWSFVELRVTPGESWSPDWERALARRKLVEAIVLVLDCWAGGGDFLELYLTRQLDERTRTLLDALKGPLPDAWSRRRPTLVSQAIALREKGAGRTSGPAPGAAILGLTNPTGLSRAEWRVCALLSIGLTTKRIAEKLGVTEATVRSHLRNIYAKTETSGQYELLHRMLATQEAPAGRSVA